MTLYKTLMRPLLFRLDAEWCHDRAMDACALAGSLPPVRAALAAACRFADPMLETEVCGLKLSNPIGLAAGFDKNGRALRGLAAMGFGHLELGSVSADPSDGNPKPRLWRLADEGAIVVHYGLPNEGAQAVAERLAPVTLPVPLGINIVKTNRGVDAPPDSDDEIIDDYVRSVRALKDSGDYLTLNLSCPNTEMGRSFFAERGNTARLLSAIGELDVRCPVFLKVSPLAGVEAIEALLEEAEAAGPVSGFIFNLPPGCRNDMPGAVAGKPIERQINDAIRELYTRMDTGRYRIIGAGGVFSPEDAYEKIRLGASLVQLVTALVFEGPTVVKRINRGLCRLLQRDGFSCVAEAVGTGLEPGTPARA